MKTLISSALLFCVLAAALWPVPEAEAVIEPKCDKNADMCTDDYTPVCGTDGNKYSNECRLCLHNRETGQNVKIAHRGEC
uniref:Proteinase inhibitor PSKP-1 n=1 Tax=Pithecopus nordestinus TaxID=2034992 RepID=K9N2T9_PITNO|nr:proteinase inhibitor PSKP-1 [Pithecopus nordestinus]